jgi:predicted PhzF superfamily epimerase YddE/YHI9
VGGWPVIRVTRGTPKKEKEFCDGGTLASSHVAFIALYLETQMRRQKKRKERAGYIDPRQGYGCE